MNDTFRPRALSLPTRMFERGCSGETGTSGSLNGKTAFFDGACAVNTLATQVRKRLRRCLPIVGGAKMILVMQLRALVDEFFDGPKRSGRVGRSAFVFASIVVIAINVTGGGTIE